MYTVTLLVLCSKMASSSHILNTGTERESTLMVCVGSDTVMIHHKSTFLSTIQNVRPKCPYLGRSTGERRGKKEVRASDTEQMLTRALCHYCCIIGLSSLPRVSIRSVG